LTNEGLCFMQPSFVFVGLQKNLLLMLLQFFSSFYFSFFSANIEINKFYGNFILTNSGHKSWKRIKG